MEHQYFFLPSIRFCMFECVTNPAHFSGRRWSSSLQEAFVISLVNSDLPVFWYPSLCIPDCGMSSYFIIMFWFKSLRCLHFFFILIIFQTIIPSMAADKFSDKLINSHVSVDGMDEWKKGMALLHQLGLSSCGKQDATLVNLSEEIIYCRIAGVAGSIVREVEESDLGELDP